MINVTARAGRHIAASLLSLVLCGSGGLAYAAEGAQSPSHTSAEQQLLAMAHALDEQSYQGTLTYEFGGPLETLAFERLVQEQGTQERIRHLSGRPRDFSRSLPSNYCGNAAMRLFAEEGNTPFERLGLHYDFQNVGENRVADRIVDIVKITPKDTHRYGFTLGIDRESHLPLMLTLTGERGQVLERFQFVELTLGPIEKTTPVGDASQRLAFTKAACSAPESWQGWRPQWLPAGFVAARVDVNDDQTVMSFTDGLASISIFVSPIERVSGAVGVVQRGATVAAMTMVALNQHSFKVSVVGEVPPAIARKVASSVAYQAGP
ncbi:MucB/RseB C-terminal domain-containing protein [Marinagarivorans cellulosilyticus]|uniref:Sigma-E factor negative regulatory protein RseB n=1 Tax=Marinagarivorans cellulosilyticus TaxID=2721545 RepID=A0AAN1WFS0_9GAMM|nr:MucB/RseB C-terminal domain-containing protein [Marinagarivorans cellulosilyticus]BCD96710.1 sigma-E factor negative regulatory protein RseB [Marinagarivorans cellulosilyticus]